MSKHTRIWSAGLVLVFGGWALVVGEGSAGGNKSMKDTVLKIAEAIKKGDTAGADKQAADAAKKIDDLADLMDLFKKRDKGGLGVGSKPGSATPDGIEMKLNNMTKSTVSAGMLKTESDSLEEMGYAIAAMAKITKLKPVAKAKAKDWNGWCDDIVTASVSFSKAAKAQSAADLKSASAKITASCNACHSDYRK